MDFMRSQLDRRRFELEQQRRKFLHEILGMRGERVSNANLTDLLKQAFKDDAKEDLSASTRRSGLHEGMGSTHLSEAASLAKAKAQTEQLMKLRNRMTALTQQLSAQQEFSDSILDQRNHWKKVAEDMAKGEKNQDQAVQQMKLGMKFASGARLSLAMKKQTWWSGRSAAVQMLLKIKETLRNQKHMTPAADAHVFESLLCLFGSSEVHDFFLPRYYQMRSRQKIIDHEKSRGVVTRITTEVEEEMVEWMHNVSVLCCDDVFFGSVLNFVVVVVFSVAFSVVLSVACIPRYTKQLP